MANDYVEKLKSLLTKLQKGDILLDNTGVDIEVKNFFGGGAVYFGNQIFMTLTKVGLALKLSPNDLEDIMKIGGKELRYFPKGHIKKQYSILPENIIMNNEVLLIWVKKSINFVDNEI